MYLKLIQKNYLHSLIKFQKKGRQIKHKIVEQNNFRRNGFENLSIENKNFGNKFSISYNKYIKLYCILMKPLT